MPKDAERQRNRDYVRKIKEQSPCTDCGKFYHFSQMDFDHLGDKKVNVATLANSTAKIAEIKKEIAKCQIVCANCHRLRTWQRLQYEI